MVSTLTNDGQDYVLTLQGSFDFAADTGSLVITFPGGAISRTEELFTESSLYFRLPADPSQPEQLIWVRIPRAEAKVRYLLRPPGNDPEYVLAQLPKARSVRLVGSEQVGGVALTRYQGSWICRLLPLTSTRRDANWSHNFRMRGPTRAPPSMFGWTGRARCDA